MEKAVLYWLKCCRMLSKKRVVTQMESWIFRVFLNTMAMLFSPASRRLLFLITFALPFANKAFAQQPSAISFTISMEDPSNHYYHIEMACENIRSGEFDVKLPAWTPGYYWMMNFSKNVVNFNATNAASQPLHWDKKNKNTWTIQNRTAGKVLISYDVFAFTQSVADAFLDTHRGYLSTAAVLMHPAGALQQPSTVTLKPYRDWQFSYTGLQPVPGKAHTYTARNFDELYDCPVLLGNQYVTSFVAKGLQHRVVLEDTAGVDQPQFTGDLQKMVNAATDLMGHIPYRHYTFMIMGEGRGGLEHRNSTAVFSGGGGSYGQKNSDSYKRWLNFLTHEYFHLYNIKAIRPIALGPFDYDKENYTHMLWVSEGFTVYYEYLILNRAGLLTRNDVYKMLRGSITNYENSPGHLFQSVTQSSFDTWIQFFNHDENTANTTISYYDKGCALGLLLDLKIRHETKNKHSLDDVMRRLYKEFYQQKQRGFTDEEFRTVCENIAGVPLPEIFDVYATTTLPVDYAKYLAYAGLSVDLTPVKTLPPVFGKVAEQRSFEFKPLPNPDALQSAILNSWVKD